MIALAAVALCAGFNANAANDEKCDEKCDKKCEQQACSKERAACPEMMAFKGIELTDAQKEQLKALNAERCEAARKAKEAKKAEKGAKAEARKQARQEYFDKVKAILTPEQYTQFLENQLAKGKDGRKHMGKGARPGMKGGDKTRQFKARPEQSQRADKAQK